MDVRSRLVTTGVELLERDGLESLTLRTIARAANVSHGAPRHHFPTYAALLAAIAREGLTDLDAVLSPTLAHPDPVLAIRKAARVYLEFAMGRPEMFALITRHDLLEGAGGHLREITGAWFRTVHTRLTEVRNMATVEDTLALWAGVQGLASLGSRRATEALGDLDIDRALSIHVARHLAR